MNWPVFFKRLGSAIVFAAIMMAGLLVPDPYAIFLLALLIQFLCLKEFMKLMPLIFRDALFTKPLHILIQLAGIVVVAAVSIVQIQLVALALLFPLGIWLFSVLSKRTALLVGTLGVMALFYISLPMGFLVVLRNVHPALPLALILMIWMNDTMAYIVGSFIGKTPFSAISPKKTWEGTLGGALLTLVGAAVWAYYSPYKQIFTFTDWMVLAGLAVVAGTAGDLLESKLKRLADVKDSGTLMPGHGGALDRFDSLLVTLPFAFCYVCVFMDLSF
jgi:phosphatidate cytidylyltransferase